MPCYPPIRGELSQGSASLGLGGSEKKKKKSYAGPVVRPWSMLLGPSPRNLRKWVLRSGCPDLDPATMCGYWLGVGGHLAHPPVLLAFMFPRCLLVLVPFFL